MFECVQGDARPESMRKAKVQVPKNHSIYMENCSQLTEIVQIEFFLHFTNRIHATKADWLSLYLSFA